MPKDKAGNELATLQKKYNFLLKGLREIANDYESPKATREYALYALNLAGEKLNA